MVVGMGKVMNMREKMARAMHRRSDRGHHDWGDEHPNVRREFTAMADAALSAMEEPTEAMMRAAVWNDAESVWRAMIRKAKER